MCASGKDDKNSSGATSPQPSLRKRHRELRRLVRRLRRRHPKRVSSCSLFEYLWSQCRKQNYIFDAGCTTQQHNQTIDANTETASWWQTKFERTQIVFVDGAGFEIAGKFRLASSLKRSRCSIGSFNSLKPLASSWVPTNNSNLSVKNGSLRSTRASGEISTG